MYMPLGIATMAAIVLLALNGMLGALAAPKAECRPSTGDKIGVTYANGECHILPKRMIGK